MGEKFQRGRVAVPPNGQLEHAEEPVIGRGAESGRVLLKATMSTLLS